MKICGHFYLFFFREWSIFLVHKQNTAGEKKKISIIHQEKHNHTYRYPTKSECESNFNLKACLVKVG